MALRAKDEVIIFAGSSNPKLAQEIARYLEHRPRRARSSAASATARPKSRSPRTSAAATSSSSNRRARRPTIT